MSRNPEKSAQGAASQASGIGYIREAARRLEALLEGQEEAFALAADAVKICIANDGRVFIFGTGHSHMLAEEGHYRAGGLACVVPILSSAVMLHESATESSRLERLSGLAEIVLSRYEIEPRDVVIVFSTSGVNAMPVEAAKAARATGATVIAVTSRAYSAHIAAGRERLDSVATIVLDNKAPPGDACVPLTSEGLSAGPISTIAGAALLNALLIEASARLLNDGVEPPVYRSANMPGAADRNAALVARYRQRNPHL